MCANLSLDSGATLDIASQRISVWGGLTLVDADAIDSNADGVIQFDGFSFSTIPISSDLTIDGDIVADRFLGALENRGSLTCNDLTVSDGVMRLSDSTTRAVTVTGNLTVDSGETLDRNRARVEVTGNVVVNGTYDDSDANGGTFVSGNWTDAGTFTIGTQTVTFDGGGTSVVTVPDSSDFFNLTITGSTTVRLATAADINGTATIAAGSVLDADGDLDVTGGAITLSGAGRLQIGSTVTSLGTFSAGTGTVEYDSTSAAQTVLAVTYYDLEVDKSGQVALTGADITVSDDLIVSSGELEVDDGDTLRVDDDVTVSGTLDIEPGSTLSLAASTALVIASGGTFEAVGSTSTVATVTATDTGTPGRYSFSVAAGGIMNARYVYFRYMDSSGIRITDNNSVTALTQLSDALFDNGPSGGTLLSVTDNDNAVALDDLYFYDTNGSTANIATTNASAAITVNTYGGDFGGPDYENDNGGGTVTPGFIVWSTFTPVRISFFEARPGRAGVELVWRTASERKCAGFRVERSEFGAAFVPVDPSWIPARGFTGVGARYELLDLGATAATAYRYRLVERDVAGRSTVVSTIKLGRGHRGWSPAVRSRNDGRERHHDSDRTRASATATGPSTPGVVASVYLETRDRGVIRVTRPELSAAGFDVDSDPRRFALTHVGEPWPCWIEGESDGTFDSRDTILFFAPGIESPDTAIDVFRLDTSGNGVRWNELDASTPVTGPLGSSERSVEIEHNEIFLASGPTAADGDPWVWDVLVSGVTLEIDFSLKEIVSSAGALIEIWFEAFTEDLESLVDHETVVRWNQNEIGSVTTEAAGGYTAILEVPSAALSEGCNTLELEHIDLGVLSVAFLDKIRVTAVHRHRASGEPLRFATTGGSAERLDGFDSDDIIIVRYGDGNGPSIVRTKPATHGQGGYAVDLLLPPSPLVEHEAVTPTTAGSLCNVRPPAVGPIALPDSGVDFIVIAPEEYLTEIAPLVRRRESQGWRVFVASLQSVYDAYDGGRATTHALQSFIAHVHATGFGNPPSAVLLVGDATYDPRGNLGVASRQVIPTRLVATETLIAASDDALVDVDQDGWPDLAIGRLPVATTTELAAVVDKLVNFDPGPRAIPTPGVLVVDQAPEFTWMTQELQESLGLGWAITQLGGAAGTPAETDLEVAWATDPRLVMYAGHSGRLSWGLPSFLSVDDVPTLVGQQDLPLVVAFNCLSAYFTHPDTHSIGERMVLEGNAGAIAYWGPTAITTTLPQIELGHAFAAALSDPMILSIGEATLAAKRSLEPDEGEPERSIRDIVRTWILLGDPTTRP